MQSPSCFTLFPSARHKSQDLHLVSASALAARYFLAILSFVIFYSFVFPTTAYILVLVTHSCPSSLKIFSTKPRFIKRIMITVVLHYTCYYYLSNYGSVTVTLIYQVYLKAINFLWVMTPDGLMLK